MSRPPTSMVSSRPTCRHKLAEAAAEALRIGGRLAYRPLDVRQQRGEQLGAIERAAGQLTQTRGSPAHVVSAHRRACCSHSCRCPPRAGRWEARRSRCRPAFCRPRTRRWASAGPTLLPGSNGRHGVDQGGADGQRALGTRLGGYHPIGRVEQQAERQTSAAGPPAIRAAAAAGGLLLGNDQQRQRARIAPAARLRGPGRACSSAHRSAQRAQWGQRPASIWDRSGLRARAWAVHASKARRRPAIARVLPARVARQSRG